jgi:hypothetical protein
MNIKRMISSVALAGIVGASTLGIGTGIANASPAESNSGTTTVQPVGWHGGGGHGYGGHGFGGGWGGGYRGGWGGDPFWHPWGWPWRW